MPATVYDRARSASLELEPVGIPASLSLSGSFTSIALLRRKDAKDGVQSRIEKVLLGRPSRSRSTSEIGVYPGLPATGRAPGVSGV